MKGSNGHGAICASAKPKQPFLVGRYISECNGMIARRTRSTIRTAVSTLLAVGILATSCPPPSPTWPVVAHGGTALDTREADARVRLVNGCPQLFINGRRRPPLALFVNIFLNNPTSLAQSASEIRLAAKSGIHIVTFLCYYQLPYPKQLPPDYQQVDMMCKFILRNNPKAWLLPRVWCGVAGFRASHPAQQVAYANGSHPMSSVASRRWYRDTAGALAALIRHIQASPYAMHIIGYHLAHGNTGEWFTPNYGTLPGFDYSRSNRLAFARWLKRHYRTNGALRTAWHDGRVSFQTVAIPPAEPATNYPFYKSGERRYVDYLNYQSDITAERIMQLATVVKRVTAGRSMVVTFYGYDFELPTSDTSDRALARLLRCKDIDALASPVSYHDRQPGGSPAFMGPVDSATLHGKLWMMEDDTRTFLHSHNKAFVAPGYVARCKNLNQTNAVHNRNFGQMMVHRLGTWWMDLEGTGWLNNTSMWKDMDRLRRAYLKYAPRSQYEPQVAVIYDERSPSYARVEPGRVLPLYSALVTFPTEFFHCGASVGFYLLSDLKEPKFPHAKVFIFLNAWHVNAATRRVIREKVERGGHTVIWMYGAGFIKKGGIDTAAASRLIGIKLRLRATAENLPASVVTGDNALHLPSESIAGVNGADAPSWAVADSASIPLAYYVPNGGVSMAIKQSSAYQSIFIGDPRVAAPIWLALLPHLGVHVYLNTNDCFQTDGRLMMISSDGHAGIRTVTLPNRSTVYNLLNGRKIAVNVRYFKVVLRRFQTLLLRIRSK
ncbi:MAG: hypothetical protein ACP5I8_02985 [Phycisphaerae bacterium]